MKFLIPHVGFTIKLTQDYSASIAVERRNNAMLKTILGADCLKDKAATRTVLIPMDTTLVIDRVYVRKGYGEDYNSITLVVSSSPDERFVKQRFFIPLSDANKIEFDVITITEKRKTIMDVTKEISAIRKNIREQYGYGNNNPNEIDALLKDIPPFYAFSKPTQIVNIVATLKDTYSDIISLISNYLQANLTVSEKSKFHDFYFKVKFVNEKNENRLPHQFKVKYLDDQRAAKIECLVLLVKSLRNSIEKMQEFLDKDVRVINECFRVDFSFYNYHDHVFVGRDINTHKESLSFIAELFDVVKATHVAAEWRDYAKRLFSVFIYDTDRILIDTERDILLHFLNIDLEVSLRSNHEIRFKKGTPYSSLVGSNGDTIVIDSKGDSLTLKKAISNISAAMKLV
jgi:hypothetical protein